MIALMCLGVTTVTMLQGAILGTALPLVVRDFGIDYDLMGYLFAFWVIVSAVASFALSGLTRRLTVVKALVFTLANLSLSNILTAISWNLTVLNIARIWGALVAPFIWPLCAMLVTAYAGGRLGFVTAVYSMGSMHGLVLSYVLLALASENWRLATLVTGLLGLAHLCPLLVVLRSYSSFSGGAGVGGVETAENRGETSGLSEHLHWIIIFLSLGHFAAIYSWNFAMSWLSTFLTRDLGLSYSLIAVYMILVTAVASVWELFNGRYIDRASGVERKLRVLYAGMVPSALLLLLTLLAPSPHVAAWLVSASLLFWRSATPVLWSILGDLVPLSQLSRASSAYMVAVFLSGITSSVITGYFIATTGTVKHAILLSSLVLLLSPLSYTLAARGASPLRRTLEQAEQGIRST
ncbi:MAG: MFS transporter [Thermoproteota archaeon]